MFLYRYTALSETGAKVRGVLSAESRESAVDHLLKERLFVTSLAPYKSKKKGLGFSPQILMQVTRDFSLLLRAGLPLYETLRTVQEKYSSHKIHPLLLDLSNQIKQGKELSAVVASYPATFTPVYIAMVKAGEEAGKLEESFAELSTLLSRTIGLKKKVISALIYPLFLGTFASLVIGFLLFFLIPSMKDLFADRELHPFTSFVLELSTFLHEHLLSSLCLFSLLALSMLLLFCSRSGNALIKKAVFRLPLIKTLLTQIILNRFARVFSTLLLSGIPLLDGLRLARQVLYHPYFETLFAAAEERVIEGKPLSEELQKSSLIPNLFIRMLSVGEEAGDVGRMMAQIASLYDEEVEKNLARFTALLQPSLLLVLGAVVALVLLAVLLPLTDVHSMLD